MHKILVIEDEEYLREIITDLLEIEGYEWKAAKNGREGIVTAKEYFPDLIICDVMMPHLNGHQVFEALKNENIIGNIPFIFLTALTEKKDIRTGMALGADDYITKPFNNEELLNSIKVRLEKASRIKDKMQNLREQIAHALPHEIKNPLITILGYSELINDMSRTISPDLLNEYAETVNNAGLTLNRMVQNYILYSKIQIYNKNNTTEQYGRTEISNDAIIKLLTTTAKNFRRPDDIKYNIRSVTVKLTQEYFLKIIEELLHNAFNYSSKETVVEVTTETNGNDCIIKITDEGRGITPERLNEIMELQHIEYNTPKPSGTGLGLLITFLLIKSCGGSLTLNSTYGLGTTAIAKIPM